MKLFVTYDTEASSKFLKELRLEKKLTQKKVSLLTGINIDSLRRIEKGEVIPRFDTIILLSNVYNHDILYSYFNKFTNHYFSTLYKLLDKYIICNDSEQLILLEKDYLFISEKIKSKLNFIDIDEFTQVNAFIAGINSYLKDDSVTLKEISFLFATLNLKHSSISYETILHHNYSFTEIRIVLLIALFTAKIDINYSTMILNHLLSNFNEHFHRSSIQVQLYLKILYNLSYNYYKIGDDQHCLKYSIEAISLAFKEKTTYMLPYFFARKGISEFYLHDENHQKSLALSLELLNQEGNTSLFEKFKYSFCETHGIILRDQ